MARTRDGFNDMDWDKLKVFHAAAEAGSFTHAQAGRPGVALIALCTGCSCRTLCALQTLGALRASRALHARNTLNPLCPLWTCGALRPRVSLGTWIPPAGSKRQRHSDKQDRDNSHETPPRKDGLVTDRTGEQYSEKESGSPWIKVA